MVKRILTVTASAVLGVACVFMLFLPLPAKMSAEREEFTCRWENGTVTTESFETAYPSLIGAGDRILLERDGLMGEIEAGEEYRRIRETLERGTLAELLRLKVGDLSSIELAALWRNYSKRGYYSGEFFTWNGEGVVRAEKDTFEEVFLLTGDLPADLLKRAGTKRIIVHGEAKFSAKGLVGSEVTDAEARFPYFEQGGAIYLNTAGGVRLIAALPNVTELTIECDFLDEGALSPCVRLEKLTLPKGYEGGIARLFGDSLVPVPI